MARPDAAVLAVDLSPEALALARENALLNSLNVAFVKSDLLNSIPGPFDLILANLPYLPEGDRAHAEPEVRHDPELALYSGPDGLALARRLIPQARAALAEGGALWLELDPRNAPAFAAELRAQGWAAALHPDLTGRERFVRAAPLPSRGVRQCGPYERSGLRTQFRRPSPKKARARVPKTVWDLVFTLLIPILILSPNILGSGISIADQVFGAGPAATCGPTCWPR